VGNRFHEETTWKILQIEGQYHNAFKKILNGWVDVDGNCLVTAVIGIIIVEPFGSAVRETVNFLRSLLNVIVCFDIANEHCKHESPHGYCMYS